MDKGTTKVLSTILKIAGIFSFVVMVVYFIFGDGIVSLLFGKEATKNLHLEVVCVIFFIPFGIILFIANTVLNSREKKHRADDLRKFAQQQGWKYETQQHLAVLPELAQQIGLASGSFFDSPQVLTGTSINVLQGQISNRNFLVCDQFFYTTGESHRKVTQTLIGIEIREANLPFFALFPKGSVGKLLEVVDLDYTDPFLPREFTDKYEIERQNRVYFNQFFNAEICEFYLKKHSFRTVCGGRYLFIYDEGVVLNPQQILDRLKFIETMANLFIRSNNFR